MRRYTCPRRLATATMLGMLAWNAGTVRAQTASQGTPPATQRLKPAAFSGIQPGTTTLEDVNEAWGRPVKVKRNGATIEHVYRVEPYAAVEVTFHRDRVAS
ncbi:MAG TPA: hypothetical protein VHV77_11055, partial [Pirellulales bacterium]|nr:hypothetical protein [Pirellulales bacterium]